MKRRRGLGLFFVSCYITISYADSPRTFWEWRASTFDPASQHEATVIAYEDGELLVAWSSRRQQDGRSGIYAQRFAADGTPIGLETPLGVASGFHQTEPAVAVDSHGSVWVVWQGYGNDGSAGAIVARRLDRELRGPAEFVINTGTRGHQCQPALATSRDGRVLVTWTSQESGRSAVRVCARLYGADGAAYGSEWCVSGGGESGLNPAVAAGDDGTWAIAYSAFDSEMQPMGVRVQRLSADGERLGETTPVSAAGAMSAVEPAIVAVADGWLVGWLEASASGDGHDVMVRRLTSGGLPRGEVELVSSAGVGPQSGVALAAAADGRIAVAWNQPDGDEQGVYARVSEPGEYRWGPAFRLTAARQGMQNLRAAAGSRRLVYGPQGLICAWSGDAGLGDKSSANVTVVADGTWLPSGPQGVQPGMAPAGASAEFAGPHIPPSFDPALIDPGEREVQRGTTFGFDGILNTGWTPPDPHMAVGPDHIVVMANGQIAFYDKDGNQQFQDQIEGAGGFWGSVGATDFVFDPEAVYDELSGRFFVMAAEAYAPPNQTRSYVLVAVSDDSNPNGTWYKYRFNTTSLAGNLFDSPNIGVDANVVYITGDGFGVSANYPVYTFDKASLMVGLPPAVQRSTTLATATQSAGIPPVSYDNPPALYMIEHAEGTNRNYVRLIALRDPLGTPQFTTVNVTVPVYSDPGLPPQQGTTVRPETFDARFWSVAYRDGSLWATHHVNSSPVRARWYQIAMNGWPTSGTNPQLVQSGEITTGAGVHTYFSAISVNERGDAAVTCARSGTTLFIGMLMAYRYASDPLNTMRTPVLVRSSSGPYNTARWGDYAAVQPDPAVPNWFWAHHEYALGQSWRTWVQRLDLPRGDVNCDGVADFGDINVFVLALSDPATYAALYPNCPLEARDINGDGALDFADINPFVALLTQ